MPLVFVYGTLMRRGANHDVVERVGGRFLATARTREPRVLVDLGPYPALLDASADGAHVPVAGEIWAVETAALAELDAFEGCPDLYTRERITVVLDDPERDDRAVEAFTYVLVGPPPEDARVVESGRYTGRGSVLPEGAAAHRRRG